MAKQEFNKRKPREQADDFIQKTLDIKRVTKVVKGGRTMRFLAVVVVGDKKGSVGMGLGKASEVPAAIEKAVKSAKKSLIKAPIVDGTIPHEIIGKFCTSQVIMMPTKKGNGIIAGGAARTVVELAGYTDVTTKIHGSTNKINVAKATFNAIQSMRTKEQVAALRGIPVEEI